MTFTYDIHTRGAKAHLVSWSDGLSALVTGTWAQAVEVADGRLDRELIRILARGLRISAQDLRASADAADRAALEVETTARAATIRSTQAPRKSKEP